MRVVTAAEMRQLDQETIDKLGIPSIVLMENAGTGIVRLLMAKFGSLEGKRIHILVGPGNNGGDGLVAARHLLNLKARPKVYLTHEVDQCSLENQVNLEVFKKLGGDIVFLTSFQRRKFRFSLSLADIIVDALLGIGATGPLRGNIAEIVSVVNEINRPVVSVDVPTGVDATTGAVSSTGAVKADFTAALGFLKMGCLFYPGRSYVGEYTVLDIGIPHKLAEGISTFVMEPDDLSKLPERPPWGHKGTFGHTLVVAGSLGMAGAASLTSQAVYRGGGGLVSLAVPRSIVDRFIPNEVIVKPIPDTPEGTFGTPSIEALEKLLDGKNVLAIGPGLSNSEDVKMVVEYLLTSWKGPVVIDADALNILTREFVESIPEEQRQGWVLTPHPGEMGRLVGQPAQWVNERRGTIARELAARWGVTVVLKGAPTVICGSQRMYISTAGNPGMGSAGMGDVLTGVIAALLSQGLRPFEAAALGAYIHGLAGDSAAQRGMRGLMASDCLAAVQSILE